MSSTAKIVVDRSLLNNAFDGYKLASEGLCTKSINLPANIDTVSTNFHTFSYAFSKCTRLYNHLYVDTWSNSIYYVDASRKINKVLKNKENDSLEIHEVFQLPDDHENVDRFCCSLSFPSESYALASNGLGKIYTLETGKRCEDKVLPWCLMNISPIYDLKLPGYIKCSKVEESILHMTTLSLRTIIKNEKSLSVIIISYLTFDISVDKAGLNFKCKQVKSFLGKSLPNSCWMSEDATKMFIISDQKFALVDSSSFEPTMNVDIEERNINGNAKTYEWRQNKEFISMIFIGKPVVVNDVDCTMTSTTLSLAIGGMTVFMDGSLEKEIIPESSKWFIQDGRLEIVLTKKHAGAYWSAVMPLDMHGSHIVDGEEQEMINEVQESLAHLTTDKDIEMTEEANLFNMQQLEECDETMEELSYFSINVNTGRVEVLKNFGNQQWIFERPRNQNTTLPSICLRYDVDGLVWEPLNKESADWKHVSTLDAFGYVLASKEEHKFVSCSPSFSYSVITDCNEHAYIYKGHSSDKQTHKDQYVVNCKPSASIYGCQCTDEFIYILSDQSLTVIKLP